MNKFSRSLAVATVLTFSLLPGLSAETMGTNPKPTVSAMARPSMLATFKYTVLAYFGF